MIVPRHYYIVDDYGDIYNVEPFDTLIQASAWMGFNKRHVNRITELHIECVIKPGYEHVVETPIVRKVAQYANSEF